MNSEDWQLLPVINTLPVAAASLPFRLERPAPAAPVVCAAYTVACIPGTTPARGRLELSPAGARLSAHDYCKSEGRPSTWLPPQIGDMRQFVNRVPPRCSSCSTLPLLPRRGVDVPTLSECHRESYEVLQCSRTPLAPAADVIPRFSSLPPVLGSADVLLVHTDHFQHGLFAMVERVVNQVLFARASHLEPYVFIGEHVLMPGSSCEHGTVPYHDPAVGDNVWEYAGELHIVVSRRT